METERITELIEKARLNDADKDEIIEAATLAGLDFVEKRNCRKCYDNLLLRLFELENAEEKQTSLDGYQLKRVKDDLLIGNVRVNNATISNIEVGGFCKTVRKQFFENEVHD